MDYNHAFELLSDQEFAVIYWKCQGLTHTQVGDILGWGMDNVQKYNSSAHKKLGLGDLLAAKRQKVMDEEICPALREWIKQHTEALDRLRPPEGPQLPPEIETVIGEEVEDIQPRRPPPPPIVIPSQKNITGPTAERPDRRWIWIISICVICTGCVGVAWLGRNRLLATFAPTQQVTTPTKPPQSASTVVPTLTPVDSPTPTDIPSPTLTYTPEVHPTAFPLPIKENFNQQYSDLWTVSGDPIVAKSIHYDYDGVLTTRQGGRASISIGNTAWTNYAVTFRSDWLGGGEGFITIGVRMTDLNNMIQLACRFETCDWIVVYQGEHDVIQTQQSFWMRQNVIVSAEGDTFTAFGDGGSQPDITLSFILPPKYKGKFPGGGVYLEISNMEVDYVEIQPLK